MIKDYTQTWGVSGLEKKCVRPDYQGSHGLCGRNYKRRNGESDCFKAGKRS